MNGSERRESGIYPRHVRIVPHVSIEVLEWPEKTGGGLDIRLYAEWYRWNARLESLYARTTMIVFQYYASSIDNEELPW